MPLSFHLKQQSGIGMTTIPKQLMWLRVRPGILAEFAICAGGLSSSIGIEACGKWMAEHHVVQRSSNPGWTCDEAEMIFRQLLSKASECDGNVVVQHAPPEWKESLNTWGRCPADLALQKAVRRALDPQSLFNPGRFVTDAF